MPCRIELLMPTCIYCVQVLPEESFNKEHVIPRQLGSFHDNPTLIHAVCIECNRYFGSSLELAFGRDSIEAVYRLRHGQKRPEDIVERFKGERLSFRIPGNMPAGGAILVPAASPDGKEIVMLLPPQVGVQVLGESKYHYYTADDLISHGVDLLPAPDQKVKLRLLAQDDAGGERIRALVLSRFPKFREAGKPPLERIDRKMLVEIKSKVDRVLARAISKIAFNYMAFHAGSKFALNESFDSVRRFIRYDEVHEDWPQFVRFLSKPLLADETDDLRVTQGHLVIVGWRDFATLEVRLSPYNSMAYEVTLTQSFRGVWQPIQTGHVFDWEHHEIFHLKPVPRRLLPSGWAHRAARAYQALVRRPPE